MNDTDLQKRVTNLEIALHAMWAMLEQNQSPHMQEAVTRMMQEHFAASYSLGGFRAKPGCFHAATEDNL